MDLHRPDPTTVVLRPVGVLDAVTAPRFEHWLAENLVFHTRVEIDLSGLSSCSTETFDVLVEARRRAAAQHVELVVLAPEDRRVRAADWTVGAEPRVRVAAPAPRGGHSGVTGRPPVRVTRAGRR